MARRNRQGVLKRQRERKKAEKALQKREQRSQRQESAPPDDASRVASADELAGYGLADVPESESDGD